MPASPGRFFPRLEGEEREKALAEAGPSWRQWFYFSFAKVWTLLAFFILDVFVFATFAQPFLPLALFPSLALALYAEYLLYEYLWFRPPIEKLFEWRKAFRRTWYRPVPMGRWTVEAEKLRGGVPVFPPGAEPHPDPEEFL